VQHRAHFVGWQVNIRLAVVAQNKTMTVAMAGNGALEFSEESGRCAGSWMRCFDKKSRQLMKSGTPALIASLANPISG